MPIASTAALPADVLAALPEEEARAHLVAVYNSSLASGDSDEGAWATAWRGLENAGWAKGADGIYTKTPKRYPVAKRRADGVLEWRAPVSKVDGSDDEVTVSGWASVAVNERGELIVDHDNEIIPVPVLERAAADFLAKSRAFNAVDHYSQPCGELTQSIVMTPATRVAMKLDGLGPVGWWVSAKIRGPAARRVRSGELREFSIEAVALKRKTAAGPVVFDGLEVDRITLVDAGAGIGVRIEAVKSRSQTTTKEVAKNMDPSIEEILAALNASPEQIAAVMAAFQKAASAAPKAAEPPKDPPMPPEVAKRLDDERVAREAVAKQLDETRAQLAARDLADSRREYTAKAAKLRHLPVDLAKLGEGMRLIDGMVAKDATSKDALEAVTKALEVANETIKSSALLQPIGGSGTPADGSAAAQLEAKAREIVQRDEDLRKMPVAKAMKLAKVRAYDENPDLYEKARDARN